MIPTLKIFLKKRSENTLDCALQWCFFIPWSAERESWMAVSDGDHAMAPGGQELDDEGITMDKWMTNGPPPLQFDQFRHRWWRSCAIQGTSTCLSKGLRSPRDPVSDLLISQNPCPKSGAPFKEELLTLRHAVAVYSIAADCLCFRVCEEQVGMFFHSWWCCPM